MARTMTPKDAHVIINAIADEALGKNATVQAVDTSTFVSVGETLLNADRTNVYNALSYVLGRTFVAVRPYKGKFYVVDEIDAGLYGQRTRKISYYEDDALSAGHFNTDLNGINLADGRENTSAGTLDSGATSATGSQWEQHQKVPLEVFFGGSSVWQYGLTRYEDQIKAAFRSEQGLIDFMEGMMTEAYNDIETEKESFRRLTVLNHMAGVIDLDASMPGSAVNLTAEYNARFGTSYTTAQLLSTYLEDFLKFFVSTVKISSDFMTNRSLKYHWNPGASASKALVRHTPKDRQKLVLYGPLMTEAQSWVYPALFNPEYLNIDNFESVDFWQNINDPMSISVTPAIPDVSDPTEQTAGDPVETLIVGMLFDKDAVVTNVQLDDALSTPLEARKRYRNIWWSFAKNAVNDFTENAVVFYMADPVSP